VKCPLSLLLLCAIAVQAQAASFDCVAPVFPPVSTSSEGVRRVEKQVRQWRACTEAHRAQMGLMEVERLRAEVDLGLAKWIASTRAYSNGQFKGQQRLTEIERGQSGYGAWLRGSQEPSPPGSRKL
jgi:hypothetical protein